MPDLIKSQVQKCDSHYLLGDVAFKNIRYWRQRFRVGDIWLIRGNHDPSMSACQAAFGKARVRDVYEGKLGPHPCSMSHYAHAF